MSKVAQLHNPPLSFILSAPTLPTIEQAMLTLTCELQFPDGAMITAIVKAESYEADYPAVLSGAVDRLPEALRVGKRQQAIGWELAFKSLASETGAGCTLTHQGRYDWWAK